MLAAWRQLARDFLITAELNALFNQVGATPNRRQSPSHSLSLSTSKPCSGSPDLLVHPVGIEVSSGIKAGPS